MRLRVAVGSISAALLVVPLTSFEATAAAPVRFSYVQYNSPGTDTGSNKSLNAEYIVVKNYTKSARSLTGWTIRDPKGHVDSLAASPSSPAGPSVCTPGEAATARPTCTGATTGTSGTTPATGRS